MNSSRVTWDDRTPGRVTISQGLGPARLVGAPFFVAGVYFLYQFVDGALHPSQMTVAGWLLLPAVTAAFLVPGWILLFGRKRVRLDATLREVTEEFAFGAVTRRRTSRISPDAHVMLRYEKSGGQTFAAHVYLVVQATEPGGVPEPDRNQNVLLALFPSTDEPVALDFARQVAQRLGADVQDLRVEHGEVNAGGVVVERLGPDEAD
jgi:hypothetical protein